PDPGAHTGPTAPPNLARGVPDAIGPTAATTVAARPASGLEGVLRHVWPEEGLTTAPLPLLGSVAIGVLAATLLPERNLGLAAFVILLLGGGLVLALSRRRARPWTLASAALCVVLGSFVVLRDAGWLTFLS